MAQKVAKLGIEREAAFMYFIAGGDVWRVPREPDASSKRQKVARAGVEMNDMYIYFLDRDGDIARAKRQVGGTKKPKRNPGGGAKKRAKPEPEPN